MIIKQQREAILEDLDRKYAKGSINAKQKQEKISLLEYLEGIEDKYTGKHLKCSLYGLYKNNKGSYGLEPKLLIRANCLFECEYFIDKQWDYQNNGQFIEIDFEATDKNIIAMEVSRKASEERERLEIEIGIDVAESLKAIGQSAKSRVGRPSKK